MNKLQLLDSGLQANDKYQLYIHHRPKPTTYTIHTNEPVASTWQWLTGQWQIPAKTPANDLHNSH